MYHFSTAAAAATPNEHCAKGRRPPVPQLMSPGPQPTLQPPTTPSSRSLHLLVLVLVLLVALLLVALLLLLLPDLALPTPAP